MIARCQTCGSAIDEDIAVSVEIKTEDLTDEIERLRAENHSLKNELEALRKDAERYDYLRDIKRRECLVKTGRAAGVWCDCEDESGTLILLTEEDLDAAIDAAMKGE